MNCDYQCISYAFGGLLPRQADPGWPFCSRMEPGGSCGQAPALSWACQLLGSALHRVSSSLGAVASGVQALSKIKHWRLNSLFIDWNRAPSAFPLPSPACLSEHTHMAHSFPGGQWGHRSGGEGAFLGQGNGCRKACGGRAQQRGGCSGLPSALLRGRGWQRQGAAVRGLK